MKQEIVQIKKQLEEIPEIKQEIVQIKEQVEEIPEMKQEIVQIKEQVEEIPEMKQELRNISGSVARIEVEHGEKLVTLFDAYKVNAEKIEEQDKRITKCKNILEKQDNQLYILNSKIKNA